VGEVVGVLVGDCVGHGVGGGEGKEQVPAVQVPLIAKGSGS
jgi:uncharacterized protein YcfJ